MQITHNRIILTSTHVMRLGIICNEGIIFTTVTTVEYICTLCFKKSRFLIMTWDNVIKFSLLYFRENIVCANNEEDFQLTSNMLLHYLVKLENKKQHLLQTAVVL